MRVCLRFLFCLMYDIKNVNTLQQLTWNKFKVSKQPPLRMQSGQSFKPCYFSYYLMKPLYCCKNQESCWKKNLKGLKYKIFVYKHKGVETTQYWLEIIFKSFVYCCRINFEGIFIVFVPWKNKFQSLTAMAWLKPVGCGLVAVYPKPSAVVFVAELI